jgi:hypothetical protein
VSTAAQSPVAAQPSARDAAPVADAAQRATLPAGAKCETDAVGDWSATLIARARYQYEKTFVFVA